MKKIIPTLFLFIFLFSLSSCFDITEEVKMNTDGSGKLKLTINMSQSKANLKNYMNAGEINGVKIPTESELKQEIAKLKKKLANIKGISNIQTKTDFTEFIFEVSSDFSDAKALNKAINASVKVFNQTPFPLPKFKHFDISDNQFSRLFEYTNERLTKDEYDGLSSVVRYLMESAKIVSIYRFDEPVTKFSNKKAHLSPSKKAIKLEANIADFAKGIVTLENHISF